MNEWSDSLRSDGQRCRLVQSGTGTSAPWHIANSCMCALYAPTVGMWQRTVLFWPSLLANPKHSGPVHPKAIQPGVLALTPPPRDVCTNLITSSIAALPRKSPGKCRVIAERSQCHQLYLQAVYSFSLFLSGWCHGLNVPPWQEVVHGQIQHKGGLQDHPFLAVLWQHYQLPFRLVSAQPHSLPLGKTMVIAFEFRGSKSVR